ncbi:MULTISPECIES: glycosyltransferase [unclassified Arthrobacter]|uniref:glycosyltransferase n=2 Tax=Arthrobacter TaxID=1663 RepID=UPI0024DFD98C|nr:MULTISPECIES: glycosyltransferase [unclassified Arthrobacter]MCC9146458.1 glycosyltransferase [Arthrobacter sp. zg-Y919]MDK1277688.1 glycosyltransferase [Arthrobacter sp. zg.Y919]WIB02353.1 glycosyltransferase [Arthrobacter sp. zg-Y919]
MSNAIVERQPDEDSAEQHWSTLQRVILPSLNQLDTVPLYMDTGSATGVQLSTMNGDAKSKPSSPLVSSAPNKEVHAEDFLSRHSTSVRAGERASFGTYFNAFPASYWRRWTNLETVRLRVRTVGTGAVSVYKSSARGALQHVQTQRVTGEEVSTFELSLNPFGDGGWYWFDLVAGSKSFVLEEAEWQAPGEPVKSGTVTLEITTLNKTSFCINNLRILGEHPEALANVKEVLIVDQGTQKVADAEGFAEVEAMLGGKLRIVNQANLGGSGGFARGMYEAVESGSDYVLLLDDDVVMEPESISRLLTFADRCKTPTIVGGHMFDLYNRTVLHTFGETVNSYRFQPDQPHAEMSLGHDFVRSNLRQTSWMHRRVDVDYNGWWMCLIPTQVIRDIGLSLPVFIKWDDAEYGLRAKSAGYPTVSMPGSAVWHVSWIDKDDLVGWQAYFHTRNRMIAALIHSPYEHGGRVVRETGYIDLKHLISMQYYTAQGRVMAMRDLLKGPGHLHELLPTKLPEIRAMAKEFSDSQIQSEPEAFPAPVMHKPPRHGQGFAAPSYATLIPWAAKTVVRQLTKKIPQTSKEHPQAYIAHQDNKWWRMSQYDSAVVSNAEGTGASWYQRDPKQLRVLLAESLRLNAEILKNWQSLSDQYREALPEITSFEAWKSTFEQHSEESK